MPEEFTAKGYGGTLAVTPTKVIISRKGLASLVLHGLTGDKEILIKDITSIQFRMPGITGTRGYIQFTFPGAKESKGGLLDAMNDENTVVFSKWLGFGRNETAEFIEAKQLIEKYRSEAAVAPSANVKPASSGEELERLAGLVEKGYLTREEYDKRKREILGI